MRVELADELTARLVERLAMPRERLGPRRDRLAASEAVTNPTQSRAALTQRLGVVARQCDELGANAAEHPVEVRAAHRWAPLHHCQPIGQEDENREPRPERIERGGRTVEQRLLGP